MNTKISMQRQFLLPVFIALLILGIVFYIATSFMFLIINQNNTEQSLEEVHDGRLAALQKSPFDYYENILLSGDTVSTVKSFIVDKKGNLIYGNKKLQVDPKKGIVIVDSNFTINPLDYDNCYYYRGNFVFNKQRGTDNYLTVTTYMPDIDSCLVSETIFNVGEKVTGLINLALFAFVLLVMLILILVFYKLTRRVTKPISTLTDHMTKFEKTNFTDLDKSGLEVPNKEVYELNRTFEDMSDKIIRQTSQLNRTIDLKTKDLDTTKKSSELKNEVITRFKSAVDSAQDLISVLNTSGMVIYINQAVTTQTGYTLNDAEGKLITDLWYRNIDNQTLKEKFAEVVKNKKPTTLDYSGIRKDSSVYESEIRLSPIFDQDGGVRFILMIERDVTEANQKERLKNEFISIVSHELRTPMTIIKGYANLLSDNKAGEINQQQKEFIDKISFETSRLVELTNDMLDLQKFESGKFEDHKEDVDVLEVVNGIKDEFSEMFKKKFVDFVVENKAKVYKIFADKKYIYRALLNLVQNAYKFTDKGSVTVSLVNEDDKTLTIFVKDTGVGIPKDSQSHLFAKFYQASNVMNRKQEGTGLGLSVVKTIVDHNGGTVTVESTEGKGSIFKVVLPIKSE